MLTVLLVEDEPAMAQIVATALTARGYRVQAATTGRQALEQANEHEPDLVVLDLGLPDIDGVDVCRELRRWFTNPIVVLSADGDEDRKVAALDEGADDYVTKPFSMPELLARLRVADRHRRSSAAAVDPPLIDVGDLTIDIAAHVATAGGERIDLTPKEFAVLAVLARYPGRLLTHGALLEAGKGGLDGLRVTVTQLRKKLGRGANRPQLLTEPGVGYRLSLPD